VKLSNEIKIGITVVAAVLIGVIGFRIMRNVPLFDNGRVLYARFAKVDGLVEGRKILFNGVEIGSISSVSLTASDSVVVGMGITNEMPIPSDSRALIRAIDFLGSKAIVIEKGKSNKYVEDGAFLIGVYDEGAIGELQEKGLSLGDKVAEVGENLNKVLKNVNATMTEQFQKDVQKSVSTLDNLLKSTNKMVDENRADIKKSIQTLQKSLASIDTLTNENRPEVKKALKNLNEQLEQLEILTSSLEKTSDELGILLQKINRGEGTLGKLANDPSLYTQMDSLALSLQRLIRNIDRDPKRYLQHVDITLF
jgi:ABC-type transporter Mla subunit MlaD